MDIYALQDKIPLSYSRVNLNTIVTGLTVTVVVKSADTGATLLASTSVPEVLAGSGIYTYEWVHGLTVDTPCIAIYTAGGIILEEFFLITYNSPSRAV